MGFVCAICIVVCWLGLYVHDRIFYDPEMGLASNDALHSKSVFALVALRSGCLYSRPAAGVERLLLERSEIGIKPHFAAKGIKLKDEVAFGQAAYRWITGHPSNRIKETRHQKGFDAHACGNERGFGSGMTASDNNDVVFVFHAD